MADLKYSESLKKIEDLIVRIENDEIDVDELAAKVKDAAKLIRTCKDKIDKAEIEVKKVVDDLSSEVRKASDAE